MLDLRPTSDRDCLTKQGLSYGRIRFGVRLDDQRPTVLRGVGAGFASILTALANQPFWTAQSPSTPPAIHAKLRAALPAAKVSPSLRYAVYARSCWAIALG